MTSTDDLLRRGLRRLYSAHGQGLRQINVNLQAASATPFRHALEAATKLDRRQIERLEKVFNLLKLPVAGEHDLVMAGIAEDNNAAIRAVSRSPELDQELIRAGQLSAHYYLASYGTMRDQATASGERKAAKLLQKTLDEFGRVDRRFTKLADKLRARSATGGFKDAAKVLAAAGAVAGTWAWLNKDKADGRPIVAYPPSTAHPHQPLLRDAGHQPTVTRIDTTTIEPARVTSPGTVTSIEQPVIHTERLVQPERVV